jgi:immune inhibitor A
MSRANRQRSPREEDFVAAFDPLSHRYGDGPTTCMPRPEIARAIAKEVRASRSLSRADVRLAAAMGLIGAADARRKPGFNDGQFYPPTIEAVRAGGAARANLQPTARLSLAAEPRTTHALALLVDFSDNPHTESPAHYQSLLFDPANAGSMTSYYTELSRNQLTVSGEVSPQWIRAPHPYAYYVNGQSGTGDSYPNNTPGLLRDVLVEFCKTDNLKRFDRDGDGYVDGVFLIHAGGGAEAERDKTKRPDKIWSHKWVMPEPFENTGVKVYAYSTEPEDGRVGVFAHEYGHVLGLPDLYDTTYFTKGVGDWCLMGGGSWGGDGNRPTRMSAWCLQKLGWIKPKVVARARTISIPTLATDPKACYKVWTKGKPGREYFLLENRQQAGMDADLPGGGLAVWHIDESENENTNPNSYLAGLVQADGQRDLENNANGGDDADLFPGSKNVRRVSDKTTPHLLSNNGLATGVVLSGIKEAGGVVTVSVKV